MISRINLASNANFKGVIYRAAKDATTIADKDTITKFEPVLLEKPEIIEDVKSPKIGDIVKLKPEGEDKFGEVRIVVQVSDKEATFTNGASSERFTLYKQRFDKVEIHRLGRIKISNNAKIIDIKSIEPVNVLRDENILDRPITTSDCVTVGTKTGIVTQMNRNAAYILYDLDRTNIDPLCVNISDPKVDKKGEFHINKPQGVNYFA